MQIRCPERRTAGLGPPMNEAIDGWRSFYAMTGGASATLVALLFVAASVGSGAFRAGNGAALRMFLSASVVHFSSVLAVSLLVLAPVPPGIVFGLIVMACGLYGLSYSAVAWRAAVRDGVAAKIDLEDRLWYAAIPACAYVVETCSGMALALQSPWGLIAFALAVAVLLFAGIHNAWDITVWSITRRRE